MITSADEQQKPYIVQAVYDTYDMDDLKFIHSDDADAQLCRLIFIGKLVKFDVKILTIFEK